MMLVSCSSKRDKYSNTSIISSDSMIHIMVDIHIADATIINALNNRRIKTNSVPAYYSYILEQYGITKKRFDASLRYYCDDLEKFDKMYDEIIAILNTKQIEIEAKPTQ